MPLTMEHLLEPFSLLEFHADYYEKKPLLIKRQSPTHYEDLLTLEEINRHIGETHLPSTAFRMARNGDEMEIADFTYPDASINNRGDAPTVDKDMLFAKWYEGWSIIIMQYESPAMLGLRHVLERTFHGSAIPHIYLTPRNSQGFTPHWDSQDTFIMQFDGTKEWMIYDSPVTLPTRRQLFYPGKWTKSEPTLTATLEPGDLLYIPRGFIHEARARDAVSGHITTSLHTHTYADLLWAIADNADVDPWLRKSLPAEFYHVASGDEFLRNVRRFFDNAELPAYIERLDGDFTDDLVSDAKDRLADYVKLSAIGMDSRFRMRSIVRPRLTNGGEQVVLTFHRKSLEFPASAAESIRHMIDTGEFTVSALPGNCEDSLALCSRLVQEGFLGIA